MTTLEKILQEIEDEKEKRLNIYRKENDPVQIAIIKTEYNTFASVIDIIKKHLSCENKTTRQSRDNGTIRIDDDRLWKILYEEACVEGQQAERIHNELKEICGDGWIPCSERMPEKEYDTVLCVTDTNHYFVGVYNREFGFRTGDIDADGNVIAWHPLPEPYKLPVESADSKRMREREEFFEDGE